MRAKCATFLNEGLPTNVFGDGIFMPVRIQSHEAMNPPSKDGNGSAQVSGDYERPEEALAIRMSHC